MALALAGRDDQAKAAAEEAERLAGRLHYPVGHAAKAEAAGACADDAADVESNMEEARRKWSELGRPLDAARCLLVWANAIEESDPERARELNGDAAEEYESLGVEGLAKRARELVG